MAHFQKLKLIAFAAGMALLGSEASADQLLTSTNNTVRMGVSSLGYLNIPTDSGEVGLGYNFSGQGGRTGYQDALSPGCYCEAWGVAANGQHGYTGANVGTSNITSVSTSGGASAYTSVTSLSSLAGMTVTQTYSLSNQTATGALFVNSVTIHNGTGATITDLRYGRAMDWDVPPTEFNEYTTFVGTGTTSTLLRSTDDGFATADPITNITNPGISAGAVNADGTFGPADHGSLFLFSFGDLADGADYTFNIFYGAGANEADALSLLSAVSPELYNLGQSADPTGAGPARDLPTFVFAFNGVGGSVVVPPSDVPEPATWAMMVIGFGAVGGAMRRRRTAVRFA